MMGFNLDGPITLKNIQSGIEAKQEFLQGAQTLVEAVGSTLGPEGKTVLIEQSGYPIFTKDGVSVAKSIHLTSRIQNMAAQAIKQAAERTLKECGDGTTTSTVLAGALLQACKQQYLDGSGIRSLVSQIKDGAELVKKELISRTKPASEANIGQVAWVSSNGDKQVSDTISEAFRLAGKDGQIIIEQSAAAETTVEHSPGYEITEPLLHPAFINDDKKGICTLDNPYILLFADELMSSKQISALIPLLDKIKKENRSLAIGAYDIGGDFLQSLIANSKNMSLLPFRIPRDTGSSNENLEDLSDFLCAPLIRRQEPYPQKTQVSLGSVLATKSSTLFIAPKSNDFSPQDINQTASQAPNQTKTKISQLHYQLSQLAPNADWARQRIQNRIARLQAGVVRIMVGSKSPIAARELKDRFDDCLGACLAARAGVLPGAGLAYLGARAVLGPEPGHQALYTALQAPNDRLGRPQVGPELVDPAKVILSSLDNAVSVATTMLQTDFFVTQA